MTAVRGLAVGVMGPSLATSLLASWSFDDGSGSTAADGSGNGHAATWGGTLGGQWGNGLIGGAGICNGSNNVLSVPQSARLNFERTNPFSIACWVKPTNVSAAQFAILSTLTGASLTGYEFSLYGGSTANGLTLLLINSNPSNRIMVHTGAILSAGAWQHIAVTYDGSSAAAGVAFYLNAVLQAKTVTTDALTASMQNNQGPTIGARPSGVIYYNGSIDQLDVWGAVLTPAQLAAHYNSGAGMRPY